MTVEEMEVTKEDVFETMNSLEKFQEINKDKPTIPEPYLIKGKWLYYRKITEYVQKEDKIEDIYITSTPPILTERYQDIETGDIYFELEFEDKKGKHKLRVNAGDITQARNIVELANKGLEITQNESPSLVHYLSAYRRWNNIKDFDVATRLGHIGKKFISPYVEDNNKNDFKLFNSDPGKQKIIDGFRSKGNIEKYIDGLFKHVKDNPMVMMMFYGSVGSILVKEFGTDSIIIEQAVRTSKGKTFTERVCASVWGWHEDLVMEWNTTKTSVERMAAFLNSFPLIMDDTRKANYKDLPQIFYQFSGGKSKGRATKERGIDVFEEWNTILLSTGEVSTPDISEKGGVAGRVITLLDNPFPNTSQDIFNEIAETFESNYGLLGKLFIEKYNSDKDKYKSSFKGAQKVFIDKAEGNEVMVRIARSFALLQVAGEILNDIEGFEHDPYIITHSAFNSMIKNNKNIDKSKKMLEELLDYLYANRNSIEGEGYGRVTHGDVKAIYKKEGLCILTQTVKDFLGDEVNNITGGWVDNNYLIIDKDGRRTKRISHKGTKPNGYMIKKDVLDQLDYDFSQYHNPYGYD
ncbi:DUF927 domain-containing protein [Staphylococcus cohnii]|uniref:DUF927 domain-containing protein n=1 Tax=Staphylococcus cohnii TaxID=29382 RepID=UPI003D7EE5DE